MKWGEKTVVWFVRQKQAIKSCCFHCVSVLWRGSERGLCRI